MLAGDCNASVGTYAGLGAPDADMAWFDARAADKARSGYFDGMGVATLTGQCLHRLVSSVRGLRLLDPRWLIYCGISDFEPGQREKV